MIILRNWALKCDFETQSEKLPNNLQKAFQIIAESMFIWRFAMLKFKKEKKEKKKQFHFLILISYKLTNRLISLMQHQNQTLIQEMILQFMNNSNKILLITVKISMSYKKKVGCGGGGDTILLMFG